MTDKGFWGRIFGPAPSTVATHSFDELQRLHEILLDPSNQVINAYTKATLIETLRALAELLIWGDQNDPRVFEFFLEHNMLIHFKRILEVPDHRRGDVAVQLLQTLSILITNISKQTSMFFLFSNNHLNDIIALSYDLRDEEVLAHYVTLLKTISFKLNTETIQFFFQIDASSRPHFPLYTEAMKLFNHSEGMVRAAVRMLTINVYNVGDAAMMDFVASPPCSHYFNEVSLHLSERVLQFDRHLLSLQNGHASALASMNSVMTELEDCLSYIGDVLEVAAPRLRTEVSRKFWDGFIEPSIVGPLLHAQECEAAPVDINHAHHTPGPVVRPISALYSIERAFVQVRAPSMLEALACALLAGPAAVPGNSSTTRLGNNRSGQTTEFADSILERDGEEGVPADWGPEGDGPDESGESGGLASSREASRGAPGSASVRGGGDASSGLQSPGNSTTSQPRPTSVPDVGNTGVSGRLSIRLPRGGGLDDGLSGELVGSGRGGGISGGVSRNLNSYTSIGSTRSLVGPWTEWGLRISRCREAFMGCLRGSDPGCAAAAVRVLVAVLSAKLPPEVTRALGIAEGEAAVVPLGVSEELPNPATERSGSLANPVAERSGPFATTGELAHADSSLFSTRGLSPRQSMASSVFSMASDNLVDDLVRTVVSSRMRPAPDDATRALAEKMADEVISALLVPLARPIFAADAVAATAWVLRQLLPPASSGRGRKLPATAATALHAAATAQRQALIEQLQGVWADAIVALLHAEWPRMRAGASRGALRCTPAHLLNFLIPAGATPRLPVRELEDSALAAVGVIAVVSRTVAFAHTAIALTTSQPIPLAPPISPFDTAGATIAEGALVSHSSLPCHACKVSFKRGDERAAMLTVLPHSTTSPGCSSPHAVLVAPASRTVTAGHVLSAAPLLASSAAPHRDHRKWMVCHVRPTVAMLQESIKAAKRQGLPFGMSAKAHQLGDGVWVLSFDSAAAVLEAVAMLEEAKLKAQAEITDALSPLHAGTVPF